MYFSNKRAKGPIKYLVPGTGTVILAIAPVQMKHANVVLNIDLSIHIEWVKYITTVSGRKRFKLPIVFLSLHVDTDDIVICVAVNGICNEEIQSHSDRNTEKVRRCRSRERR